MTITDAVIMQFVLQKMGMLMLETCRGCNIHIVIECIAEQSAFNRRTVQPFTESDDTRCCDNTICPPEDGHVNARNMSRIIM